MIQDDCQPEPLVVLCSSSRSRLLGATFMQKYDANVSP